MLLGDKVALVTGAARGIGRAIATGFTRESAHVAAVDIDGRAVKETVVAIEDLGQRSLAIQADVGSLDDIDRMVQDTSRSSVA